MFSRFLHTFKKITYKYLNVNIIIWTWIHHKLLKCILQSTYVTRHLLDNLLIIFIKTFSLVHTLYASNSGWRHYCINQQLICWMIFYHSFYLYHYTFALFVYMKSLDPKQLTSILHVSHFLFSKINEQTWFYHLLVFTWSHNRKINKDILLWN